MNLDDPVTNIKGVGEKTAAALAQAGIFTLRDLLYTLPRAYENYQAASNISAIRPGKVVIRGFISDLSTRRTSRRGLSITEGVIRDKTDAVRVVWFNQPYRAKQFLSDREYYFSGEYTFSHGRYQLIRPNAILVSDLDKISAEKFQPIYVQRGSLNSAFFKKLFNQVRPYFSAIPDLLPPNPKIATFASPAIRRRALMNVHFPDNPQAAEAGRDYLAYEELFEFALASELNKSEIHKLQSITCPFDATNTKSLVSQLPFELTPAQRRSSWEILQDLAKPHPMNRLLQGDVGSGKTVVAAIAAYQAIKSGHQVAVLAPTSVLANQHAESFQQFLAPLGVRIALLTSSTKHKTTLKQQIQAGEIDLVIGTHAILTDDTFFHSLALAIIDEQHRFGVEQRQKLLLKAPSQANLSPHLLMMTATPIPRSLQLSIFGDIDVSIINSLPKGRQPIITKILNEASLAPNLYPTIRQHISAGEQVYWICKSIEDSPQAETVSVKKQSEKLRKIFPRTKIQYLHGRMKPAEKDQIMTAFSAGEIDILVSTTVVEVGVNVPNATIMVIMDAEGFGLAQLHQLRGRVGRGHKTSACYLIVSGEEPPSRRLRELAKSTDGFRLAEIDLKLRGPGAIYGKLQHGALDLRIATLDNTRLIVAAARHAKQFAAQISQNPEIMLKYKELKQNINKYQQLTTLN